MARAFSNVSELSKWTAVSLVELAREPVGGPPAEGGDGGGP